MVDRLEPRHPDTPEYRQTWRIVDGAVASAFTAHPDFIAPNRRLRTVRNSIVKRVVGALMSYAEQSAQMRSGFSPAHDRPVAAQPAAEGAEPVAAPDGRRDPNGGLSGEAAPVASPCQAATRLNQALPTILS